MAKYLVSSSQKRESAAPITVNQTLFIASIMRERERENEWQDFFLAEYVNSAKASLLFIVYFSTIC